MSDSFEDVILAHLPSGPAWPKDKESMAVAVTRLLAPPLEALNSRIEKLLLSIDPLTTPEASISAWERELGLDTGQSLTLFERQKRARDKYTGVFRYNLSYLAEKIKEITGKTAQIKELMPRGAGELTAGEPIEVGWDIHVIELRGFTLTKEIFYKLKRLSQAHILFIVIEAEKTQPIWGTYPA